MADSCANIVYPQLKDLPEELFNLSNYLDEPASDVSIVAIYEKISK